MQDPQLINLVVSVFVHCLQAENEHYKAVFTMQEQILQVQCLVEWTLMEDGPMGVDNNDVWDFDGNNK